MVFFWNTIDEFVLPKLLAARLLVLVLAGVRFYRWTRGDGPAFRRTPVNLPLLAFVASAALSTAFAVNRNVALFGTYMRYEGLLTIATYAALFYLVASGLRGPADSLNLVRTLAFSGYIASLIAILQTLLTSPFLPSTAGESQLAFGGVIRATGTLGNANALAAFLAMLLPFVVSELLLPGPAARRVIAGNQTAMISLALVLTFSRGAWLAAAIGLLVTLVLGPYRMSRAWIVAGVAGALVLAVLLVMPSNAGLPILRSIVARLASLGSPTSGSMATRLHIWHDTLALVASRPLTGYGPDTFGLAYPAFQTGNWTPGLLIDKAHGDLLQVAATQGLIGVAAYLWTLVAFVKSFLEGGRGQAAGVFGGFVAYELQLQVNFSYLPAAAPFWVFAAAAVILWTNRTDPETDHARRRHVRSGRPWATLPASLAVIGLILPAVIFPYLADVKYRDALADVARADQTGARVDLDQARRLSPNESAYAAEAGDLALGAHGDLFGPNPDWSTARLEFDDAVRLGTFLPSIYRHLAMVDEHLGLHDEAIAAARRAVTLNRYDPANQQLLDRLTQSPSGG